MARVFDLELLRDNQGSRAAVVVAGGRVLWVGLGVEKVREGGWVVIERRGLDL